MTTQPEQLTLFPPGTRDHANLSVHPGSAAARQMTVTSGRKLLDSYVRSGPVGSLAKMLLGTSAWDSTMYSLSWRTLVTTRRHLLFQLQASVPRTRETECLSWATPNAADSQGSHGGGQGRSLRTDVRQLQKGPLNPEWVECLQGFPPGYTDITGLQD